MEYSNFSNNELINKAFEFEDNNFLSQARECWNYLFNLETDPVYLYHTGRIAFKLNDYTEAEQILLKVIDLNPDMDKAYTRLGQLHENCGNYEKAQEYYFKSVKIKPTSWVWSLLGVIQMRFNLIIMARESFNQALQIDPNYQEAYYNLALTYVEDEPNKAISLFHKAVELDSNYACAYRELGWLLNGFNELEEAEFFVRKSIELDKSNGSSYMYLGNILWGKEDIDNAEEAFKSAIKVWPDESTSYWSLAIFYEYQDRISETKILYEQALELDPYSPLNTYYYGRFLGEIGEIDKAIMYLQQTITLDPDYEEAYTTLKEIQGHFFK